MIETIFDIDRALEKGKTIQIHINGEWMDVHRRDIKRAKTWINASFVLNDLKNLRIKKGQL